MPDSREFEIDRTDWPCVDWKLSMTDTITSTTMERLEVARRVASRVGRTVEVRCGQAILLPAKRDTR